MLKDNHIVEKSKALVWAQFKDYGTGELKILDTYLSRINARDESSSFVTFTKNEYAELMGFDARIRTAQMRAYTRKLLSSVVTMELPGEGFVQYSLFSEARVFYDESVGQTVIQIDCNPKLKDAFFHLSHDGYVRYQLKNVIAMRSQYSIRLYGILKDRPFGWTVGVDELRRVIGATSPTYEEFRRFSGLVLKKAVEEINNFTDIDVKVENIRKGRVVSAIKFTVKNKILTALPLPEEEKLSTQILPENPAVIVYDEYDEPEEQEDTVPDMDDDLCLYLEELPEGFTREQADLLRSLAKQHVPMFTGGAEPYEIKLVEFLKEKVKLMKAQTTPVKNQFSWLKRAVAEDWK